MTRSRGYQTAEKGVGVPTGTTRRQAEHNCNSDAKRRAVCQVKTRSWTANRRPVLNGEEQRRARGSITMGELQIWFQVTSPV